MEYRRLFTLLLIWLTIPSASAIVAPKAILPLGDPTESEYIDASLATPETVYRRNHGVGSGYRFCDPSLQRWIHQDPIWEAGGINLYGFVSNDPVNRIDPYGESDNNRPPAIVFRPGSAKLPVYGPPRPEPGVRPPGRDPIDSTVDAISIGLTLVDILNPPVSPVPDGVFLAAFLKCGKDGFKNQIRRLSIGEIKKLKKQGYDPHDLKPNSKFDLFRDKDGNIQIRPKDGTGPGDPTGLNINDLF